MSSTIGLRLPNKNRILANLPRQEYERLLPVLEPVHLARSQLIYEAGSTIRHAYFPLGGMLSLLSVTQSGGTIEVAMIGNEGLVGIPTVLRVDKTPYQIMVQLPTDALRLRADVLREAFNHGGVLQDQLLRFTHTLLSQITQSAVCNHFHKVEERLCRWLLVARDRVKSDQINLTQECIAHMLGAPRTSVTTVARALQERGLIRYSRGKIQLLDRPGLEAFACECYRIIRQELEQSLAA
jgi:CRP-like cAMP-binding protein